MIAIFGRLAKYCYFCMFYIVEYISKNISVPLKSGQVKY